MMKNDIIELPEAGVVEEGVHKRIVTTGVKGLNLEKAQELGLFTRVSHLLCAAHTTIATAYRIYGGIDYILSSFGGRRNDIAKAMNDFERAYDKFFAFWTNYYTDAEAKTDLNDETEILFQRVMDWMQLPMKWELGQPQKVQDDEVNTAIRFENGDKVYTMRTTQLDGTIVGEAEESWAVTKFDTRERKQVTVETDLDKASAMMVAKRLSDEDKDNFYTASMVRDYMYRQTDVIPYKVYMANKEIGHIKKQKQ